MTISPQATLTTAAAFADHFMPENLAVRGDGSVLVVASPQHQLWYVPAPGADHPVEPSLLHTFDEGALAQSLVEAEPDVFYLFTYGKASAYRVDLRSWAPGTPVEPVRILDFEAGSGPNGSCLVAPGVILVADCVKGLIWRLDLSEDGLHAAATVWLEHESMAAGGGHPPVRFSSTQEVPFPGINGLKYGPRTGCAYYATSSLNVVMRVGVDPETHRPKGEPEHLADVDSCDDLCLDEEAGVAYVARHPDHKIERVALVPGSSKSLDTVVAGQPFTDMLIGPTSLEWGRLPGDHGRTAYATTDGGVVKLAPDGKLRPARLIRLEMPPVDGAGADRARADAEQG